ncbi:hypothetical protein GCM10020229_56970 [Kitasatospora albolonga]|uniref:hypothetical protein n=1 Tax=Kitasatospora albolonga TaxID=68173 RepID=UPI0031EB5D0D
MTVRRKGQDSDEPLGRDSLEDRVRALTTALVDGTTAVAEQVRGLSGDEMHRIERDQSAPLGDAYRCFLTLIGGGAGRFLQGSDVFYPRVIGLGEAARELLAENGVPFLLAESDRVILMHQGYQFDFLRGPGPDPEVWSYCEGEAPALSFARFTDWLQAHVTQQTKAWARLVPMYEVEKRKPPSTPSGTTPGSAPAPPPSTYGP